VPKYIVLRTYPSYYYLESHFIYICSTIVQDSRHDDLIFKIIGTFLFIACSKPPPHFYSTHGLFPFQFNLLLELLYKLPPKDEIKNRIPQNRFITYASPNQFSILAYPQQTPWKIIGKALPTYR